MNMPMQGGFPPRGIASSNGPRLQNSAPVAPAVSNPVDPQMQQQQTMLAQMAQMQQAPQTPQMMQQIMAMLGGPGGMGQGPSTLASLMQPGGGMMTPQQGPVAAPNIQAQAATTPMPVTAQPRQGAY